MQDLELNRISKGAIPGALEKARQYRLLQEPEAYRGRTLRYPHKFSFA